MIWNGRVCAKLGMRAEHTVDFEEVKEKTSLQCNNEFP